MTASLRVDGHVAVVVIDNPPLNIIDQHTRHDLHEILTKLHSAPDVRCVVLTGAGTRAFCAGADLNEEEALTQETVRQFIAEDNRVYDDIEALAVPVVAAVNGHCMGGGFELALACDIRVSADDVKFCAAGVKIGLVVSTTRLVRLVGLTAAKDIILTGRMFTGAQGLEMGVLTRLTAREDVLDTAIEVATEIASRAPLAVRHAKQALHEAAELGFADAMDKEIDHFVELSATRDHKHAIQAFFRKEPPAFEAR